MRKTRRVIILATVLLIIIFSAIAGALYFTADAPDRSVLDKTRKAIRLAHENEAAHYAPRTIQKAELCWDKAMEEWKNQNKKIFYKRDFENMHEFAKTAETLANQARQYSSQKKDSLSVYIKDKLLDLKKSISYFEKQYGKLPISDNHKKKFASGKLNYYECQEAFNRKDYNLAEKKIPLAEIQINEACRGAYAYLRDYFEMYPDWRDWISRTIKWSKDHNAHAIIVDKLAHHCYLYRNGKLQTTCEIELGPNWIGDKTMKGDNATPEGQYKIVKMKSGGETRYYKAMLLNYPNDDDLKRFRANKKNGVISKKAEIGSLIEIHGNGGRGINWTNGCVALSDGDIDKIFNLVRTGTPVTIVGSTRSLAELDITCN